MLHARSEMERPRSLFSGGYSETRLQTVMIRNDTRTRRVEILVKKDIPGNANRTLAVALTLGKGVILTKCAHGLQKVRPSPDKVCFYDEMTIKWCLGSSSEIIFSLGISMGMWGKCVEGFVDVHGRNGIGKRNVEGRLSEIWDEKNGRGKHVVLKG